MHSEKIGSGRTLTGPTIITPTQPVRANNARGSLITKKESVLKKLQIK